MDNIVFPPPAPKPTTDGGFADTSWQKWFQLLWQKLGEVIVTVNGLPIAILSLASDYFAPKSEACFRYITGANVNVPKTGAVTAITGGTTKIYDKFSNVAAATTTFTAGTTAEYHICCSLSASSTGVNQLSYVSAGFTVGGVNFPLASAWNNDAVSGLNNIAYISFSGTYRMTAGQTAFVTGQNAANSGAAATFNILEFTGFMVDAF